MDFDHPPADPLAELESWLEEARAAAATPNWNAMTLATVEADGRPSARIVLLKHLDERGIVFFTNRESRKGRALAAHPRAALVLHWDTPGLQVQIEGAVSEAEDELSDRYFASRPRESQIGAWASAQSRPVADRAALAAAAAEVERRFDGRDVPRPPHWGGYRVVPDRIEFWKSRAGRLHDRVEYVADASGAWSVRRLCP